MSLAPEGKRILLVEDDPSLRDLIVAQLGQHGIQSAPHQRAAYEALDDGPHDLVLLDLRLPTDERDIAPDSEVGFEILRTIRRQSRFNRTAVVVMTAYEGTSETTKRALKLGADDYWNKDGSYSETLFQIVDRVFRAQEADQQQAAARAANHRFKLEFCQARKQVRLDGLVVFKQTACRLLFALRDPFVDALERNGTPQFTPSSSLARALGIDDDYLRKTVERIRARICKAACERLGVAPQPDAVIESRQWDGYRLNPLKVEVTDLVVRNDATA